MRNRSAARAPAYERCRRRRRIRSPFVKGARSRSSTRSTIRASAADAGGGSTVRSYGSRSDAASRGVVDGAHPRLQPARRECAAARMSPIRVPPGTVWMRDGWIGLNTVTSGAAVLRTPRVEVFGFSGGQAGFDAAVEVAPACEPPYRRTADPIAGGDKSNRRFFQRDPSSRRSLLRAAQGAARAGRLTIHAGERIGLIGATARASRAFSRCCAASCTR